MKRCLETPRQATRKLAGRQAYVLIKRRAPRHTRVVDEDMNLLFLGLDGLDEAVTPSLGLDIRGVRQTINFT